MSERNEKEHKELIKQANEGVKATKKLAEVYSDLTEVEFTSAGVCPISEIVNVGDDFGVFKEKQ